ncbi:MAG: hypothetical protein OXQ28_04985, partial [Acidobacteriota bacterium]|nr:hypothetical protein [Acidobacteriota bacterium]
MDGLKDETRAYLTHQQRHLLLAEPIARLSVERRVIFEDDPVIAELDVQYLALSAMDFVMERSAIESGASPAGIVDHVAAEATRIMPTLMEEQGRKAGQVILDYLANARDGHKAFRAEYYDVERGRFSFRDFRLLVLFSASDGSVAFRTAPGLALESIPAPGLEGFDRSGRLNGHRDVTRWLHEMRSGHPGNFQSFAKHKDWKSRLAQEKIDTELLANQVDFNRSEGGIEDFLNFRNESQFVRKFLSMTVPDSEAVAVRGVLADHVRRLSDLPQLERRRDALRELAERFAPFVETADAERSARDEVARVNRHASSLRTALARHGGDASRRAAGFAEEASGHETAAEAAAATCREARVRHASATVESARRRHEAARKLAETRERELAEAKARRRLLEGALVFREIHDGRLRSAELQRAIDAQHADLEPRSDELRKMGADLKATLGQRAGDSRERQRALTAEAGALKAAAREAEEARRNAEESARADPSGSEPNRAEHPVRAEVPGRAGAQRGAGTRRKRRGGGGTACAGRAVGRR